MDTANWYEVVPIIVFFLAITLLALYFGDDDKED